MTPVTGGAAVVAALRAHDVRHVFGIPGTHNLEIYRYLTGSGITHIVPRHEQGAGYAADGYARTSGRPGVVITTSGPGLTNAITAIATAYADSVPLLVISPGVPRGRERADMGWLHEMKDQSATLDAVADRSIRCDSADDVVAAITSTFARWGVERPRPVHVEIPVDVLEGPWEARDVSALPAGTAAAPDEQAVQQSVRALAAAVRPVLVIGGGTRRAAATVTRLVEALDAPVVSTVNGKGVLPESHPLAVGAAIRLRAAQALINQADALIVAGSELGDSDLWGGELAPQGTVIRVDVDPAQLHKNLHADVAIRADVSAAFEALLEASAATTEGDGAGRAAAARQACAAECAAEARPWAPINEALWQALPEDVIVAGDSSQVTYYGTVHTWPFDRPGQLLYPTGYATLGYGLPAAIGAKVAEPDRAVIALVGDGAFMFSVQELVTAAELGLALPVIVVDNGGYGEIRRQMLERGITPLAVDLTTPDLAALARAMGCHGSAARDAEHAAELAAAALDADRPTVIVLRVTS